jgi:hypothetical protein
MRLRRETIIMPAAHQRIRARDGMASQTTLQIGVFDANDNTTLPKNAACRRTDFSDRM